MILIAILVKIVTMIILIVMIIMIAQYYIYLLLPPSLSLPDRPRCPHRPAGRQ